MQEKPDLSNVWTSPVQFLAFGFGSGLLPKMPGTWGTVVAIPIYLAMSHLSDWAYLGLLAVLILVGCWLCDVTARQVGVHDYKGIVWDEIVGYLMTMIMAPVGWGWVIWGFILFRIFDIWKPWPIRPIDRHIKGGVGIVLDDLIAAVFAWIVLQGTAYLFELVSAT